MMDILSVYIFIMGLCLGSYYNVVAIRGLQGRSLSAGRSECMTCNNQIKLYDLFPVLSYLILRGKCRHCKSKFSPTYMLGELGTAITFLIVYKTFGLGLNLAVGLILSSLIIISIMTDIRERLILNILTYPTMIILLLLQSIANPNGIWDSLIGAGGIFILLSVINLIKRNSIGGGDIKLFMCIGVVLGLELSLVALFFASVLGLLTYLPLYLLKISDNTLPFAPFIGISTFVILIYRDFVISYL